MSTLKSVRIIGFKSHKDTEIFLSDGLTCLIGSGNVGKSAFVGAIRWVTENEVSKDFMTWGSKSSAVSLRYDNGIEVTRGRDGKKNYYKVRYQDGEEKLFENFGTELPDEVKKVISNVYLIIDVDKKINLNMIRQHDGQFLLKESGSLKNKAINAIIGMQYIDSAIRSLSPEIKAAESKKEQLLLNIEEIKNKIKELGDIRQLEQNVNELKKLCQNVVDNEKNRDELKHIKINAEDVQERLDYLEYRRSKCPNEIDVDKYVESVDKYKELVSITNVVKDFSDRKDYFLLRKKKYEKIDIEYIERFEVLLNEYKSINSVCDIVEDFEYRYDKFKYKKDKSKNIDINKIEDIENKISIYEKLFSIYGDVNSFKKRNDAFKLTKKKYEWVNKEQIDNCLTLIDEYCVFNNIFGDVNGVKDRHKELIDSREFLEMEISSLRSDFIDAVKSMKVCPVCNSEIDGSMAEIIVNRS